MISAQGCPVSRRASQDQWSPGGHLDRGAKVVHMVQYERDVNVT